MNSLSPPDLGGPPAGHRFDALVANGQARQWSMDEDIDWRKEIIAPGWLQRRFQGALISQFFHGEKATARVCRRLMAEVSDPPVRGLLAMQIDDEDRHARVYEKYLARLGDWAPMDPAMAETVERALQWSGSPLGLVVAFQILLEGEALRSLQDLAVELPCPLFRQINGLIARDEARHVAFGRLYLKQRLKSLPAEERMAIFRWIKTLWDDCAAGTLSQFSIPGFVTAALRRRWVDNGWAQHRRALVEIGLVSAEDMARA